LTICALVAGGLAAAACGARADEETTMADGTLTLTSNAFSAGERIPQIHAYAPEGENVSPQLAWSGAPAGTKELALIVDDPDAPRAEPWVHWVVYEIPAGKTEIPQDASSGSGTLSQLTGAREGKNDFGDLGWGGPLPPEGHGTHHYHFKLYALDAPLEVGRGASKKDLLRAMEGHVLEQTELVGTYSR
jgi:Raf kinase inhibitor-like YbhB/YbcL family protein